MSVERLAARYSIEAIGTALSLAGVVYVFLSPENTLLASAKVAFPALVGVLIVGYGIWLRRSGMAGVPLFVISLTHIVGGVSFAFFSAWLLYVARLEFVVPSTTPFLLMNGAAIGVVLGGLFGTMYVNLRHNQDLLQKRNRKLRQQNDRLDQFASIVSHDLRNPLNVAQGRLELARETADPSHFEALELALERMDAIISDMLAFARQGQTVENPATVDLRDVAESAFSSVDVGELELVVEGEYELLANESRLRQALENLFRNASEHGGDSVSTIWVGSLPDDAGFYVEDDGTGIRPEDRAEVFESGYSTTVEGTGFGLPIVQAVVEAHGWTIDVTDGRDSGARFEIRDVSSA